MIEPTVPLAVAGLLLVVVTLADVYVTVLHYERAGPLTRPLYRVTWRLVRTVLARAPADTADGLRRTTLPLMIIATVTMWSVLLLVGFALAYYDGFAHDGFTLPSDKTPGLSRALYVSGMTLSTLGYGDITPTRPFYEFLTVAQALIGFGLITLTLSYLLNVYQVLQQLGMLAASLEHEARTDDPPLALLRNHLAGDTLVAIDDRLRQLHERLLTLQQGIQRYPLVYYFHTAQTLTGLVPTFRIIGQFVAAMRWALPTGHPLTHHPWVRALVDGYNDVAEFIGGHFVATEHDADEEAVARDAFDRQVRGEPTDDTVRRFVEVERKVGQLLSVTRDDESDADRYDRYRAWTIFSTGAAEFVRAASIDFVYTSPGDAYFGPDPSPEDDGGPVDAEPDASDQPDADEPGTVDDLDGATRG